MYLRSTLQTPCSLALWLWLATGFVGRPACSAEAADRSEQTELGSHATELSSQATELSSQATELSSQATELRSQATEPYRISVVLHFANHAALTPLLKQSTTRQVRDQLRNVFGELAEVRVTAEHPLADRLAGGDLDSLSLLPADFASQTLFAKDEEQLFLMSIDFREAAYRFAWRQIDRQIEHLGPTQSRATADRQWLGKAICLAVREDFSPVGLLTPSHAGAGGSKRNVEIEFRGSQTRGGARLAAWLKPGTVLAPYWVVRQRDGSLGRVPLAYTVLRIESQRGSYWARTESNLPNPWQAGARVVGFQAVRLQTRSGKLRLRLLDLKGTTPVQAATVYAGDEGFAKLGDADLLGTPDPRGYVSAARTFNQVAYVRIVQGAGSAIEVPVPITADECELVCKVPIDRAASEKSDRERRIGYLVDDVRALQALVTERVHQINELNGAKRYEDALGSAREALQLMQKHLPALRRGSGAVGQKTEQSPAADPRLAWLTTQLDDIEHQEASLETLAGNLDSTIQKNDAQSRANVLIELGNQALGQGNPAEAIDKYTLALGEQPDQPRLTSRLDALKKSWAVHGPEHEASRRFVYQTWPATEVAQIDGRLPEAEKAEDEFEKVGDSYSPIKLLKTNEQLLADLDRLIHELSERNGDEDRKEHEKYVAVLERLAKLQARVAKYCQSAPLDLAPTTDGGAPAGAAPAASSPAPKKATEPAAITPPKKPAAAPADSDEEESPLDH